MSNMAANRPFRQFQIKDPNYRKQQKTKLNADMTGKRSRYIRLKKFLPLFKQSMANNIFNNYPNNEWSLVYIAQVIGSIVEKGLK